MARHRRPMSLVQSAARRNAQVSSVSIVPVRPGGGTHNRLGSSGQRVWNEVMSRRRIMARQLPTAKSDRQRNAPGAR